MLTLQIAVGIWLGALMIVATFWLFTTLRDAIEKNRRYGCPWWRGLVPKWNL